MRPAAFMKSDRMKCPTCKIGNLEPDVRDVPYAYRGKTTVIEAVKRRFCDNS
jgi:HTH-type transcriptional regulator/antitoxin MqsA